MPITDDFSGLSNNSDLSTLSAWDKVWSGSSQAGEISGDNRAGNIGIDYTSYGWDGGGHTMVGYRRNDGTFPDDQYSEFEMISNSSGTSNCGPTVRMDDPGGTDGGNGYQAGRGGGFAAIYDVVNGQRTALNTDLPTTSFPHTLRLDVSSQDLETFVDTVSEITTTDAGGHTSGNPGISGYGSASGNPELDDFECSDTAGAGGGSLVIPRRRITLITR